MHRPPHRLGRRRAWVLPVLAIGFLAGHGIVLYYTSSHVMVSAAVLSGGIILLVIKHVGLLGPLYALFRRRGQRSRGSLSGTIGQRCDGIEGEVAPSAPTRLRGGEGRAASEGELGPADHGR